MAACKGGKEVKILEEFSSHFYRPGFCEECEAEVEAAYVRLMFLGMKWHFKGRSGQNPLSESQQISLEPMARRSWKLHVKN